MRDVIIALALAAVAALPARGFAAQRHAMPGGTSGQSSVTRPTPPPPPAPPQTPPRTVAPPLTFPFPPLMTPPAGGLQPRAGEGVPFRTGPRRLYGGSGGYGGSYYSPFYEYPTDTSVAPGTNRPSASVTGLLRLDVTPLTAQVFVDSLYVGTVDDINAQRVLQLPEGPHRLELRAPQYQTVTVDIRISPYETVTYRAALEPMRPAAAAPAAPPAAASAKMYLIPNCYLGNIPPRANRLPSGCDIKQVQVLGPK
jgi:PEGA domain